MACWGEDGGWGEGRCCLHSLHYGDEVSAHWAVAQQDVLEEGGGIHTADLVAPMLCGEVEGEDDDEEVSAAPSADLVTLAVGAQVFHILAWAWTAKRRQKGSNILQQTNKKQILITPHAFFIMSLSKCCSFTDDFVHDLPITKEFTGMVQSAHRTRR